MVPGSSPVLGAAPGRWQEELQALVLRVLPVLMLLSGWFIQGVLIHHIQKAAPGFPVGIFQWGSLWKP